MANMLASGVHGPGSNSLWGFKFCEKSKHGAGTKWLRLGYIHCMSAGYIAAWKTEVFWGCIWPLDFTQKHN